MEIWAFSLDHPDSISGALPLYDLLGVVGVDYHPQLNSVFWTDILHGTINTARINVINFCAYPCVMLWFIFITRGLISRNYLVT